MFRVRLSLVVLTLLASLSASSLWFHGTQAQGSRPPGAAMPAASDSFAMQRDSLMQVVLASIKGRENAPAESVFKDIQVFKGVPAGRIPRIMNMGYGRSLGVGCFHCHAQDGWAKDEKKQKQVAREMAAMANRINTELLPAIKNIQSERPFVNCGTCHNGTARPGAESSAGARPVR